MSKKINFTIPNQCASQISNVSSNVTPIFKLLTKKFLKCPWHLKHIYLINTTTFTDFKNDILTGGFNCPHPGCRELTCKYLQSYLGQRSYKADGGIV